MKNNILQYFKELKFNEKEHKYSFQNNILKNSVSGLIKQFYKPFDTEFISYKISVRDNISQEEVKSNWKKESDKGITKGNNAHSFGELYPFNKKLIPLTKYDEAIVKFWNDLPDFIIPVLLELRMYHKKYLFAGTADILLYNTLTNTYIIADYKTNKDLLKNYNNQKLLSVFNYMLDNSFNKYQLQLSYYQILFEQTGLKVSSRKIIHLLETGDYKIYDTNDYTKELLYILENEN